MSAADRAVEVLEDSIIAAEVDNARWWVEQGVAALMAHPALLGAMALEAGWVPPLDAALSRKFIEGKTEFDDDDR